MGRRLYRGKRRWVSYQRMCFRVGVGRFFGLWERGGRGGFPSSRRAFSVCGQEEVFSVCGQEEVEEGFLPVDVTFGLASVAFR